MTVNMDIVNLTLGIVGTIAGVVSLTVHVWRLKKESPRLTINVLSCEHSYQHETKALSFWSEIELRNIGDRGTNILGIDIKFEDDKKAETILKMANQEHVIETDVIRWIRPHETIRTIQTAFTKYEKTRPEIECIFTIYHTHGAEKIKAKSLRRTKTHE